MSAAPSETLRAVLNAVTAGLSPLLALPPQTLSRWADDHLFLSAEASDTQGRWSAYPFQRG